MNGAINTPRQGIQDAEFGTGGRDCVHFGVLVDCEISYKEPWGPVHEFVTERNCGLCGCSGHRVGPSF